MDSTFATILTGIIGALGIIAGVVITLIVQERQINRQREEAILDDKHVRMRQYFATIMRIASMHLEAVDSVSSFKRCFNISRSIIK